MKLNCYTQQVKDYNRVEIQKYNEKVEEWRKENSHNIIPQVAFYGFRKENGELRKKGWVLVNKKSHKLFSNREKANIELKKAVFNK